MARPSPRDRPAPGRWGAVSAQPGRAGAGSEVDAQGEDAVVERGVGVADHGVVHEVRPGLLDEPFALRTLDRRDAPLADGPGPRLETLDHGIDVEILGHTAS